VLISAMYGTPETTRYLLDHGADPTAGGSMGSALHGAAMTGISRSLLPTQHIAASSSLPWRMEYLICFGTIAILSPGPVTIQGSVIDYHGKRFHITICFYVMSIGKAHT
jgi:hypothetical protein